jgi:hypothetical protein
MIAYCFSAAFELFNMMTLFFTETSRQSNAGGEIPARFSAPDVSCPVSAS